MGNSMTPEEIVRLARLEERVLETHTKELEKLGEALEKMNQRIMMLICVLIGNFAMTGLSNWEKILAVL